MIAAAPPTFRFAPTPNGELHLGHAYSALMNAGLADAARGRLLLRIEDTDVTRCKPQFETAIRRDLDWLGVVFEGEPRRQSEHLGDYARALAGLDALGLVYPCYCRRAEIARSNGGLRDPDGAPLHRARCVAIAPAEIAARAAAKERPALRLDLSGALAKLGEPLEWREFGEGGEGRDVAADPAAWGDFVLRGRDRPANYHLAVVDDDALQAISDVVRGRDLYAATSIHRLLQALLALPAPRYRHHRLVIDANGDKMSKSAAATPLRALREAGFSPLDVRGALGFGEPAPSHLLARIS